MKKKGDEKERGHEKGKIVDSWEKPRSLISLLPRSLGKKNTAETITDQFGRSRKAKRKKFQRLST